MSTSPRQDAYRAVLAHIQDIPPVSTTRGLDAPGWEAVSENARLFSAVRVALDAAGVPPILEDGWPEIPA